MFAGFSAFPLTPGRDGTPDILAYQRLVAAAATAGADSIGALGSTGSYAYLKRADRAAVTRAAVEAAEGVPVIVGVGAVSTAAVVEHVTDAVAEGAAGVLLAPVSYQPLNDDEVFGLFEDVSLRFPGLPIVLYENPNTTGFTFSDELRAHIARLPSVASLKLGYLPADLSSSSRYIKGLRGLVPDDVTIGISGDAAAARGLLSGCDVWYSILGGLFPRICRELANAGLRGDVATAHKLSEQLEPIWSLFARYGSFRVTAALGTLSGLLPADAVYAPVRPLAGNARQEVESALNMIRALT